LKWLDYLQHDTDELKAMYKSGQIEDFVALGLALNVTHVRERHSIYLVSDGISEKDAEKMRFQKLRNITEALEVIGKRQRTLMTSVLTHGGETYPIVG